MKKRYIDFVPAKGKTPVKKVAVKPVAKKPAAVKKPVAPKPAAPKPVALKKPISRKEVPLEELFVEKSEPTPASKPATKSAPKAKLGVIEDYSPKPVKPVKPVKPAPKKAPYVAPRPVFLNTNKVVKRPLSNSTPPRKQPVAPPRELTPAKPEKIITKPEKDSKAGLIIAIILTIILGAAAGTIAFLLLPK